MDIDKLLKEEWYVQGYNGVPIYFLYSCRSAVSLKQMIGIGYSAIINAVQDNCAKIHYMVKDLKRISDFIVKSLKENPAFLKELRKKYDSEQEYVILFQKKIDDLRLSEISSKELLAFIQEAIDAEHTAIGIGHIIESFSLIMDEKIREQVSGYVKDKKELNRIFNVLMSPVDRFFINYYEESLEKVAKKEKSIEQHIKEFGWVRNSYAGSSKITKKDVMEEVSSLKIRTENFREIREEKEELIKNLALPSDLVMLIRATEFFSLWQDIRKKNALIAIGYLEMLLEELSARTGVDISILRYAKRDEFEDIKDKIPLIKERIKGAIYVSFEEKDEIYTGKDYEKMISILDKKEDEEIKDIRGMAASLGNVIGRVKVCADIKSLDKINEGDILVASMTRPEYVPATRKAAAIITDEGGITCHAAIVA